MTNFMLSGKSNDIFTEHYESVDPRKIYEVIMDSDYKNGVEGNINEELNNSINASGLTKKKTKNDKEKKSISSKHVRSRFGCTECKSKRTKCDEAKPSCSRCVAKGTKCVYSLNLQYREDFEDKGKKFGREGVGIKGSKAKCTVSSLISASKNSHYLKIRNSRDLKFIQFFFEDFQNETPIIPSLRPSIIPVDVLNKNLDGEHLELALCYFIEFVFPVFNPLNQNTNNPTLRLNELTTSSLAIESGLNLEPLIQYTQQSDHVFYLIIALGCVYAAKIGEKQSRRNWYSKAESFKSLALKVIYPAIQYLTKDERRTTHEASNQYDYQNEPVDSRIGQINLEKDYGDKAAYFGGEKNRSSSNSGKVPDRIDKDTSGKFESDNRFVEENGYTPLHEDFPYENVDFGKTQKKPKIDTELCLSLVLLMIYELCNECDDRWRMYLKTCKKVISSNKFSFPTSELEISLLNFLLEYLNYQETMGRTACKDENSFFLLVEQNEQYLSEFERDIHAQKIQISWMGCGKDLVDVISDITDLSFERFNEEMQDIRYLTLCKDLRRKIDNLDLTECLSEIYGRLVPSQKKSSYDKDNFYETFDKDLVHRNEEYCFLLASEAKLLATVIYYECCLLNCEPDNPGVQKLVNQVFMILNCVIIENDFKWYSTLLWSLFIASVEISPVSTNCEELRYLALELFDKINSRSLGNANVIKEIVLSIWKMRDIDNQSESSFGFIKKKNIMKGTMSSRPLGFVNDWEKYVADTSYKVSLV